MNKLTELDLVNLILSASLNNEFSSIEKAQRTSIGAKAITIYRKLVPRLLSEFPWPFALRRKRLERASETPLSRWSYFYKLPVEYGHDWDVYSENPNFNPPSTYDYSVYKGFFNSGDYDSLAVLESGYVASNLTDLSMLFTLNNPRIETFPVHFIEVLEARGGVELASKSNIEPRKFAQIKAVWDEMQNKAKSSQSMSLPRNTRVRSKALSNVLGG